MDESTQKEGVGEEEEEEEEICIGQSWQNMGVFYSWSHHAGCHLKHSKIVMGAMSFSLKLGSIYYPICPKNIFWKWYGERGQIKIGTKQSKTCFPISH